MLVHISGRSPTGHKTKPSSTSGATGTGAGLLQPASNKTEKVKHPNANLVINHLLNFHIPPQRMWGKLIEKS
jgi:hypothetical protein